MACDGVMGKTEFAAKISETFTLKRVAISESLESQGKRYKRREGQEYEELHGSMLDFV